MVEKIEIYLRDLKDEVREKIEKKIPAIRRVKQEPIAIIVLK